MVCGILLGYLGSYLFVDTVGGWRIMYGASAVPAVILLGGMVCIVPHLDSSFLSAVIFPRPPSELI